MRPIHEMVRRYDVGEIIAERIVVITVPWLARTTKASSVIGDCLIAGFYQRHRNVIPAVSRKGPTVNEDNGAPLAPDFCIN